jgi:UDP-3-O-[3-hydroxymyristoyl] glucosamine N-acyltransferase
MPEAKSLTATELASHVGGLVVGDGATLIHRVNSLESAGQGDIAYVEDEKFFAAAGASNASCLIVPPGADVKATCRIEAKTPKLTFALIGALLHPPKRRAPEIHPTAVIAGDAQIGIDVFIGAYVCIGEGSVIGARTQIRAGAKIGDHVHVGSECVIHPNVFLEDGVTIGDQ